MPGPHDPPDVKSLIDSLFETIDTHGRDALQRWLELQKVYLEAHREFVEKELSKDNEALKHFTRLMIQACMQANEISREQRTRLNEVHGAVVAAHLQILDQLQHSLSREKGKGKDQGSRSKRQSSKGV